MSGTPSAPRPVLPATAALNRWLSFRDYNLAESLRLLGPGEFRRVFILIQDQTQDRLTLTGERFQTPPDTPRAARGPGDGSDIGGSGPPPRPSWADEPPSDSVPPSSEAAPPRAEAAPPHQVPAAE